MIVVFGAGGVAREVAWLLEDTRHDNEPLSIDAFVVADGDWRPAQDIDGVPVISESQISARCSDPLVDVYLALGHVATKRRAFTAAAGLRNHRFPALIHSVAMMDRRPGKVEFGQGVIIYPGASLSTEVVIGDFVHINPHAAIAHECRIGNFTTVCPGAVISGKVNIGADCFIGAGAIIKDCVSVIDGCTIGAGATVVKSIVEPGVWVGTPARRMAR